MSYLEISRLTKRFKKEVVLDDISLSLDKGQTLAVFGASGSGKTVLLRNIAGILRPEAGAIRVEGERVDGLAPEQRGFGMAFQNFALYPHMTAFENIASPLKAKNMSVSSIKARVDEVAQLLKIDHVLHHQPKALSNGQKQRCSLARALAPSPPLLMLDDPLRNVDAKLRYEMRLELPRLFKEAGVSVVYVTQDYKEAMALGDQIAVLIDGKIAQSGTPQDIYTSPINREVAKLFGDPTINFEKLTPTNGQLDLFGGLLKLKSKFDQEIEVGIRPEHIRIGMEIQPGAFPLELDAVTPLNVRAVLLLKARDGREWLASCREDQATGFGRGHRQVWASINPNNLHVFDATTGARLN